MNDFRPALNYTYDIGSRDDNGDWYTFSFGGYHADDEERSAKQADSHGGPLFGGPLFRSKPIDVHVCDVGE